MALTLKNPETIRLARNLASQTGMTQTAAITTALRQALSASEDQASHRAGRVDAMLRQIWATNSPEESRRVHRNMDSLYNESGLPA